jgi:amino acid permease
VLRKFNAGLALGSVGFRTFEGVLRFVAVCALLLLITLSQQFVEAGAPDSSYFQTFGVLLYAGYRWVANVGALLAFSIGCLLYYIIFYRTNLVPRWISVWGLVAAILTMLSCVLTTVGLIVPFSTEQIVLALPMLPQEMVLAVWLIVKGFNPSAIASGDHS